ncbi:hypothetical protein NI465_01430 [Acinetobacter lwoffii]|uniref:hypothetical protein n=1 Tax=Acinetobacter lwoffii TaxID=28090 RepID=UPI00209B9568|nr:hypothetical protein [Acinetobacter lwoffii]MCO8112868.1 hypothetical protein [Acinetobacter lwoffii]
MTLTEVRNALILMAQRQKRPPYEIYIAKEVYLAIKDGTNHPLKAAVLSTNQEPTLLSEGRGYSDPTALYLDNWLSAKSTRKSYLLGKLKIKPEFLFNLRFGLIQVTHPIWTEVEAAIREFKD